MDAVEFLKEKNRMMLTDSESYKELKNMPTVQCVVAYVSNWSIEHPKKTRLQEFLEKYPNAPLTNGDVPRGCCATMGYRDFCNVVGEYTDCIKCWNEPVE